MAQPNTETTTRGTSEVPNNGNQQKTDQGTPTGAAPPAEKRRPAYLMKRVMIPLVILGLAGWGTYWYWNTYMRGYDATDDSYIDGNRVAISSKMLGRIVTLAAAEGDSVSEGQVLVQLDATDLKAQQAQGNASLNSSQQNVALAKVNLGRANDDFKRAEEQYKQNVIPKEQFDHAQSAVDVARAQYAIATAQIGNAKAQLGVTDAQLQNTVISSPMNGVVSKRWVLPGDIVQPGQPIYSVYDIHHVWVTANFEETKLQSIHLGDDVEVTVDAYPDVQFAGKVCQLGANTASQFSLIPPSNASGNYTKVTQRVPVKISVAAVRDADRNFPLLPGMSVEVKIKVAR